MGLRSFNGYPDSFGSKRCSLFPTVGPAVYVQVVAGTVPVAGGDPVQALEGGMKNFDYLSGGVSDDGRFFVECIPVASSVTTTNTGGTSGVPATTYRLRWMARITAAYGGQAQVAGTEAIAGTDLSGQTVRLFGLGVS